MVARPDYGKTGGADMNIGAPGNSRYILGTSLQSTTYADLVAFCQRLSSENQCSAIDFSNTQIVTMRRHDRAFREITSGCDFFIPDGMPLIWGLNLQGAKLRDRVYGPTFMRRCILSSPAPFSHYFLGGSNECVSKLKGSFESQ